MEMNLLKNNLLIIVGSGLAMSLLGIILILVKEQIADYARYLLTIPPIGVASYVFIFNLLKKHNGRVPAFTPFFLPEALTASLLAALFFFLFSIFLGLFIGVFNRY
ncbi:hypothetical protein KJ966_13410 [bacterium]|nr:hypothetical protein [bacterium]